MTRSRGKLAVLSTAAVLALAGSAHAAPPGANDFSCHRSAAHPRPVVMIHGLGGTQDEFGQLSPKLKSAGYCPFSLTYGLDPRIRAFGAPAGSLPMEQSAHELAAFVDKVLAATGAAQVDFVGHSEGTVMPRYYLERLGGAPKVRRYVAWTPLWRGTKTLSADTLRDANPALSAPVVALFNSFCTACTEVISGSAYLNDLNADGEPTPGVEHTNIMTRYDELVAPYTSGVMQGGTPATVHNIVLQDVCPADLSEHIAMAFDAVAHQLTLNALDPATAKPVKC